MIWAALGERLATPAAPAADGWMRPADLAAARKDAAITAKIDHSAYECVRTVADLSRWIGWA